MRTSASRPRRELKFSGSGDAPSIQVSSSGVMSNENTNSGTFAPTSTSNFLNDQQDDANLDIYHYLNPDLDKLEKQLIEKHAGTSVAEAAKEILRISSDLPEGGGSPFASALNISATGNSMAAIAAQAMLVNTNNGSSNSPSAAARALAKAKEAAKRKLDPVLVQSSAISYEGGIDSATGLYDGHGKLVTIFGYEYNGNFRQGLMHGEGTIRWIKTDITYSGTFDNNAITGRGKYEWPSGDSYHGDVLNGLRHGEGSMFVKTKNGKSSYTGKWEHGKRHGIGMQIYPDQSKYTGEWKDDRRNGKGQMTYTGDAPGTFDGEWQNDVRHGQGKMKWDHPGGSYETYEGAWVRGYPHGRGVATFVRIDPATNRLLVSTSGAAGGGGATQNANKSFSGTMGGTFNATRITPDGAIVNAFDNTPIGTLNPATGQALAGTSVAEHGLSQEATKSVNRYEGEFCAGKRHGFGSFVFDDGSQYEGFWRDNVKHGEGKFTTTNGVVFAATFDNGVPTRPLEEKTLRPESLYVPTILPLYIVDILGPAEVASADTMSSIQALISRHFGLLRKVFLHYCNIANDTSIPFSGIDLNAPRAHGAMLLVQFLKFCSDSRLINRHVTVAAIGRMFLSFKDRDSTTQPNAFFAESPLLAAATAAAGVAEVAGNEKKKRRPNRLGATSTTTTTTSGGAGNNNNTIKDNQDTVFSEDVQGLIENGNNNSSEGGNNTNNNNNNNGNNSNNTSGANTNSGTRRRGASSSNINNASKTANDHSNNGNHINNNNNNNSSSTPSSKTGKRDLNAHNHQTDVGQQNQQHLSDLVKGKLSHPWKRYADKELHKWDQDPSPTLQFRDFVEAVIRVSCLLYQEPFYGSTSQKFQIVIEEHIFRFAGGAQPTNGLSQLNNSTNNFFPLSRSVMSVLSSFKPQLRKIFDRFSEVDAFHHDVPRVSGVPAKESIITLRQVAWILKLMGLLRTEGDAKLAKTRQKKSSSSSKMITTNNTNFRSVSNEFGDFDSGQNNNNDDQPPGLPSWLNTGRFSQAAGGGSTSQHHHQQQHHARRASIARSDVSTPPYFNSDRIPIDNLSMSEIIQRIRQNPEYAKTIQSGGISLAILRHLWPYDSQIRFSRAMLKKYFLISMKPRSKKQEQKQQQQFSGGGGGNNNNGQSNNNNNNNSTSGALADQSVSNASMSLGRSFAGGASMSITQGGGTATAASMAMSGAFGAQTTLRGDGTLSATGFVNHVSLVSPAASSNPPSESPTAAYNHSSGMSSTSRSVSQAGHHSAVVTASQQQQQQQGGSRSGSPAGSAAPIDDATYESLLRSKLRVLDAACGHDGSATNIDNTIALDIELTFVEFVELMCRIADCIYAGSELSEKLLQMMFSAIGPLCDVAHTVQI